jgi:DNA-binding NarL/FixJ family response regulator
VLGLTPDEEDIYRCLVGSEGMTAAKAAADTGRGRSGVDRVIAALEARGLAVTDMASGEVSAAPPAVALGALLRQHRDDLNAAERELLALADKHRRGAASRAAADLIEVITDVGAVRHRFAQLQQAARHEVRSMMVPNLSVVPHKENAAGDDGLRRGVQYRAIIDREALAQPGIAALAAEALAAGQQIRVIERVSVKLVIADSDVAMVPLVSGQNTAPESVLVRASGLLDALIEYFEAVWTRAYPLTANPVGDGVVEEDPARLDEADTQVLALLLAGLTDQAVASQLGTSLRSVQRRIAALMDRAGVHTRIQLGWHARRNGWA